MRREGSWIAGLALGLWPALALAQGACPQGIAQDGVWFEYPDRAVLTRVMSDGRIAETEYAYDAGTIYGYITLPIGLVTESWQLVDGRVPAGEAERVTYAGTPAQVPPPTPGARFDGIETSSYGDGNDQRFTISLTVGQPAPFRIGACSYTGLPVDVTRVDMAGGPVMRDAMMHIVELGLTIYLGFSDTGQPPVPNLPLAIALTPPMAQGAPGGGVSPPPLPPAGGGGLPPK